MRDLATLMIHLIATISGVLEWRGARAIIAESLVVRHQLFILNHGRKRSPNLNAMDRLIVGLSTIFIRPGRLIRVGIVLKPSALLPFHAMLVARNHRQLFSPK